MLSDFIFHILQLDPAVPSSSFDPQFLSDMKMLEVNGLGIATAAAAYWGYRCRAFSASAPATFGTNSR